LTERQIGEVILRGFDLVSVNEYGLAEVGILIHSLLGDLSRVTIGRRNSPLIQRIIALHWDYSAALRHAETEIKAERLKRRKPK
jgi:hypothetical protein